MKHEIPNLINSNLETSIFIAIATLLMLVSSRNIHLSQMARTAMLQNSESEHEKLKDQIKRFKTRYFATGLAFIFFLIALILAILLKLYSIELKHGEVVSTFYAKLSLIWIITLLSGIVIMALELFFGFQTLNWQEEVLKKNDSNQPTKTRNLIRNFLNSFLKMWSNKSQTDNNG